MQPFSDDLCNCHKCVLGGQKKPCIADSDGCSLNDALLHRSRTMGGIGIGGGGVAEKPEKEKDFLLFAAEVKKLSRNLSTSNSENQSLRDLVECLKQKLENQEQRHSMESRRHLTEVLSSKQNMDKAISDLYNSMEELERIRQKLVRKKQKLAMSERKFNEFQDQFYNLRGQNARTCDELRRLQNENQEIISDIQRLRPFQTEACKLATENMALKAQNAMLMNQFLDMQLKLSAATGESQSKENDEVVECVICMENPKTVVFKTCGHVCCCDDCSKEFKLCPVCRAEKGGYTNGFSKFVRLPKCCTCEKKMPDMLCPNCDHMSICFDCSEVSSASSASSASSHPTCANCKQTGKLTKCFFS